MVVTWLDKTSLTGWKFADLCHPVNTYHIAGLFLMISLFITHEENFMVMRILTLLCRASLGTMQHHWSFPVAQFS